MSKAKRIRGGALLARALQEKGVEYVFTLSGLFRKNLASARFASRGSVVMLAQPLNRL